jgi:hypothetical protein
LRIPLSGLKVLPAGYSLFAGTGTLRPFDLGKSQTISRESWSSTLGTAGWPPACAFDADPTDPEVSALAVIVEQGEAATWESVPLVVNPLII